MRQYFVKREMYKPWNFRYLSPNEITEDSFKLELRAFFPGCKFFENDEIIYTVVQFYNKKLDMTGGFYTIYFIKETEKVCVLIGNITEKNFTHYTGAFAEEVIPKHFVNMLRDINESSYISYDFVG